MRGKKSFVALGFILGVLCSVQAIELEAGIAGGGVFYSGTSGFSVQPGVSCFSSPMGPSDSLQPGVGASFLYQRTSGKGHTENEFYGLARGMLDWDVLSLVASSYPGFKETYAALPMQLKLRAQLALGGGMLEDRADTTVRVGGFVVYPEAGVVCNFGKLGISLLSGPQMLITEKDKKTVICTNLGVLYRFDVGGEEK